MANLLRLRRKNTIGELKVNVGLFKLSKTEGFI